MKVRKLLELQAKIEERKVPCDMHDDELNQHYSKSKEQFQNILDMDLIHLIRSYSKCIGQKQDDEIYFDMTNKKEVRKKIDDIINQKIVIDEEENEESLFWANDTPNHIKLERNKNES